MRALTYAFGEAAASLWRRRGSSLLAMLTIAIALFVLGVFLMLTLNAERVVARWTDAAELSVFLADDATAEQRAAVGTVLAGHAGVAGTEFVSSEDALKRFTRLFPELAQAAASLGSPALPASFEVRLKSPDDAQAPAVEPLVFAVAPHARRRRRPLRSRVGGAPPAGRAHAARCRRPARRRSWCSRPRSPSPASCRLALHARRQEVEIMHLVGAPLAYIRGPFVLEGRAAGRPRGDRRAWPASFAIYVAMRAQLDAAAVGAARSRRDRTGLPARGLDRVAGGRRHARRLHRRTGRGALGGRCGRPLTRVPARAYT